MMSRVTSWGRALVANQLVHEPAFADEVPALLKGNRFSIAYGLGRSYGDTCLNDGGSLIRMHRLDRILSADWERGVLRAEAGLSLDAILRVTVPKGWFLPVTPGTKFVTLGGAVANDVHGKNHEAAGTIGCHVRALGLLRSTGEVLELGPDCAPEMFAATVGGLGLTGLILWVELQLAPIRSAWFDTETIRLRNLDDFFDHASRSQDWPYTVAWVDCLARNSSLGRGLFTRGRHAEEGDLTVHRERSIARVPTDAPAQLLSTPVVRAFNLVYSRRPGLEGRRRIHYDPFLYPLDAIQDWNRLYGRSGFFQHQSVVPLKAAPEALRKLLELTSVFRQGSSLVVLKLFGKRPSPGLMSFPMEGATFALDLPNRGASTRNLLDRMAAVVMEAGGRLYPAKDASMSGEAFRAGFPRWRELESRRDPALMSDFWRRVTRDAA
jgi:FAD/FMN-containing dehydrogenase